MDSIKHLNMAIDYIESHLNEPIDTKVLAQIACTSEYHFQRMFSFLSGMSLGEYIKRRRLSEAGKRLQVGNVKVIDVALDFGYNSPDAFSRAFSQWHGMTPSEVKLGRPIQFQTKLSFRIFMDGGMTMNYRLQKLPKFYFSGLHDRVKIQFEGVNPDVSALSIRLTPEIIAQLKSHNDMTPRGMVSASVSFSEGRMFEKGTLDQWLGVCSTTPFLGALDNFEVEEGEWAVFLIEGPFPERLQSTWARVFSEWFLSTDYELRQGPEMVWYESPNTQMPNFRCELWIPVSKKG